MNCRQRVALGLGVLFLIASVVFPLTRYAVAGPQRSMSPASGPSPGSLEEFLELWPELTSMIREGFRPIWFSPGSQMRVWGEPLGIRWPIVAGVVVEIILLDLAVVLMVGDVSWRQAAIDRGRRWIRQRSRFSIRTTLLIIALTAVGLKANHWIGLSLEYRERAAMFARWGCWPGHDSEEGRARDRQQKAWAQALVPKYEQAARRPWLVVDPDPSMPE